eukprot:11168005-Lingulodinium_polyedra.AAC.1
MGKRLQMPARAFDTMALDTRTGRDEPAVLLRVPPGAVETIARAAASSFHGGRGRPQLQRWPGHR